MQSYFKFPLCFWDAMQSMTQRERTDFCNAIFNYVFDDGITPVSESVEPYFILARPYLDGEKRRILKG